MTGADARFTVDAPSGARMAIPAITRRQAAEIATHRIRVHTAEEEAFTALHPVRDVDEIEIAVIWLA